ASAAARRALNLGYRRRIPIATRINLGCDSAFRINRIGLFNVGRSDRAGRDRAIAAVTAAAAAAPAYGGNSAETAGGSCGSDGGVRCRDRRNRLSRARSRRQRRGLLTWRIAQYAQVPAALGNFAKPWRAKLTACAGRPYTRRAWLEQWLDGVATGGDQ